LLPLSTRLTTGGCINLTRGMIVHKPLL